MPVFAPDRKRNVRGERRVASLLDAAARVFGELGYHAATTNAIAAEAKVSPATLYQFFPNKEAIADALVTRYAMESGERGAGCGHTGTCVSAFGRGHPAASPAS